MHHPSFLFTILAFALVMGPLVLVHELGHYLVGRWCGVQANVFSIGFGREVLGWTDRSGTRWKLSVLPLGGYVQFAGDMDPASSPAAHVQALAPEETRGLFHARPLWQRFLIVLAGPATNMLVAVAIFAAFNLVYGRVQAPPVVTSFEAVSSARQAGLRVGDRILSVDGHTIVSFDEIRRYIAPYPGHVVQIGVQRGAQHLTLSVPIANHEERDQFGNLLHFGQLGVAGGHITRVRLAPVQAATLAVRQCLGVMGMMADGIRQILVGERSVRELGGPVKIAQYSGQALSLGWLDYVDFVALISINLAFINLLPIPGLDGGHLASYAVEAIRRRPLDIRSQEWALRTGLALVLALMVFVTLNDLVSLVLPGG